MPRRRRREPLAGYIATPGFVVAANPEARDGSMDSLSERLVHPDVDPQEKRFGLLDVPVTFAEFFLQFFEIDLQDVTEGDLESLLELVDDLVGLWKQREIFDESVVENAVTICLVSGAVVADRRFVPGARVVDVCEHLQQIRPTGAGTGYRLVVSGCTLADSELLPETNSETVTAVVTDFAKTSIMVRNVPYDWGPNQMCQWMDSKGLAGTYDLLYVPIDLSKMDLERGGNQGYYFVNFVEDSDAIRSFHILDGFTLEGARHYTEVSYARWQGRSAYVARCLQKLESGEPHQVLSMLLGAVPFSYSGARMSIEAWLDVPQLPSLHELASLAAADQTCLLVNRGGWASQQWRETVFLRFVQ